MSIFYSFDWVLFPSSSLDAVHFRLKLKSFAVSKIAIWESIVEKPHPLCLSTDVYNTLYPLF